MKDKIKADTSQNIRLQVENHNSEYELQNIVNIFKPYIDFNCDILSRVNGGRVSAKILKDGETVQDLSLYVEDEGQIRQALKKTLYVTLSKLAKHQVPWGVLTGIRPTKVIHKYKNIGLDESNIKKILLGDYCISQEKVALMMEIASKEDRILTENKEDEISIYIGIPFCPTRCLYCSFTSYSLEEKGNQVDRYLDALIKEIYHVSKILSNRHIRSIYIGGGTPTSLDSGQLKRLLNEVERCFDLDSIQEYTIEAGRPDTIDRVKLKIMKDHNVDRISINPQTMNQKTLDIIGRSHSVEDIINIFNIAREEGHNNINMDLIIGLPGETPADVTRTMREISKLNPDSITVHTMAIKRASRLKQEIIQHDLTKSKDIHDMLSITAKSTNDMEMEPYYMYRQKDTLGNFENVGYARLGKECVYNIQMIAEQQTIIAMGAGAVSKIVYDNGDRIERIPNVRNLEEYVSRVDEMIDRKLSVIGVVDIGDVGDVGDGSQK